MRLAHDGDYSDTASRSNRFSPEFGQQDFLVLMWHGGDDVGKTRRLFQGVLLRDLGLQFVQIHILVLVVQADQLVDDLGDRGQLQLLLGEAVNWCGGEREVLKFLCSLDVDRGYGKWV